MTTGTTQDPEAFVQSLSQPEVDFAIIADRVEVVNGKLYMMGGGYDRIFTQEQMPYTFALSFAVGVLVPWNACNQEHRLSFAVEDPEGNNLGLGATVGFNVGRPPGMGQGETQRVMLAPPAAAVTFPDYGTYLLHVSLNGAADKRVPLYVRSLLASKVG